MNVTSILNTFFKEKIGTPRGTFSGENNSNNSQTENKFKGTCLTHIRATKPYGVRQKKVNTAQLRHTAYAF